MFLYLLTVTGSGTGSGTVVLVVSVEWVIQHEEQTVNGEGAGAVGCRVRYVESDWSHGRSVARIPFRIRQRYP